MSDQAFAPLAYGALRGGVAALALWALLVHGAWTLTGAVDAWWLPVFVAAGGALGSRLARRRGVASEPSAPAPRWLLWTTAAIVLLSFAALALGAIATPARHWDGVVAWELKANAIAAAPDLSHPLFADPAAWHHSPSYPLLQPAVLANLARLFGAPAARLVFALLWLGLVLTAGLATWRSGLGSRRAAWVTLAVATTPFFVNPGGGGADSGYAEVFFAFALTAAAAGLLLGDGVLLAAATFLLPLLKPEGTVLVPIVALVLFVLGERRWWWPTLGAGGLALALQWQLQDRLVHHREAVSSVAAWLPFAAVAIALVPIGIRWLLDRLGCGRGIRVSVAVGVAATGIAILLALPAGGEGAVLGQFLAGFDRIGGKLVDLPTILVGLPASALSLRRFGLTFWLLLPALWLLWRRRGDPVVAATLPVVGLLALTLAAVFGAFLLSPETDVEHHLKSSAARLLSHQVGVIWLLIAVALPAANRPQPSSN